ncbi:uncharacterized protein [Leptinotarsa decemlineata]|uniref:uncharacterized protein n=1 Tax=Leptinotarsa decemlineata TaxID=7539 RepID=UPI003D304108
MQEELIEAVRKCPVLYDTNDPSYMKSKLKDDIWNTIAKHVKLKNGSEAKQSWLKLRSCHREALCRQKNTFESGSAATVIKPWRYQKQMDFLVPYMGNRPREGNLQLESEEEQTRDLPQNADIDTSVNENGNTENLSAEENTETEHLLNENTVSNSDTSKSMSETIVQKNKRMKKDDLASIMKESMIRREKRAEERAIERKKPVKCQ